MKRAWLLRKEKIISFHEVPGAELFEAEEEAFWEQFKRLVADGYRIQ